MVVQGFAQPFHCVQSPGKRGRDVFQDDAIGCAKRAHGNLAFANQERENMSPLHFLGGPGHAHAAAQQMQNRGGHPAFQNHQAAWMHGDQGMGAAQLGGSVGVCGAAQSEGMDEAMMDTGVQSALCPSSPARFQRFPSNGSTCPTYYHQAVSAVSRVDPQVCAILNGKSGLCPRTLCATARGPSVPQNRPHKPGEERYTPALVCAAAIRGSTPSSTSRPAVCGRLPNLARVGMEDAGSSAPEPHPRWGPPINSVVAPTLSSAPEECRAQVAWWSGGGGSMDAAMTCKESVAAVAAPQWQFGPEAPGNPYGGKSDYY